MEITRRDIILVLKYPRMILRLTSPFMGQMYGLPQISCLVGGGLWRNIIPMLWRWQELLQELLLLHLIWMRISLISQRCWEHLLHSYVYCIMKVMFLIYQKEHTELEHILIMASLHFWPRMM
uniref:Uncharacterized protein n=1 Tax=Opuntia streptacantha TaxID=393608 RepID=A0A7C9D5G5_OPUST